MVAEVKLIVFGVVSAALVWVSRKSLRAPRSHGFYRLFAWEAIAALILLNAEVWFHQPLRLAQAISWLCLGLSLVLAAHGALMLRVAGRPSERRDDATLLGLERTTQLVTSGAYRHIRHPLYSSLLLLAWGAFFKWPSWPGGGLALVATALITATARAEETENLRYFGTAYREYMRRTRMFIPLLF